MTPNGNPANAGIVVAAPALPPTGTQHWIVAPVSPETRSENVTFTSIVSATSSMMTVAVPVPVELVVGDSEAPFRVAVEARSAGDLRSGGGVGRRCAGCAGKGAHREHTRRGERV